MRPDDVGLHLALVELYDGRGWVTLAGEKLDLLDRLVLPRRGRRRHAPGGRRAGRAGADRAVGAPTGDRRGPAEGGPRCYTRPRMLPFVESLVRQVTLTTLLDIAITALFIYWLFSLIRGTRAVTLVIGVSILLGVYALAQFLQLRLFTQLLQAGAVVGLFALVVVFQPELRRGARAHRAGRAFGWLLAPAGAARASSTSPPRSPRRPAMLSREGHGALIVLERETGLEEIAETGVMVHADLSHELLCTIFAPRTALHDGAVIIRGDRILAAAALLPLTEMSAVRAVRHAPPGGARDHRGHGRGRGRRVRGERPDERRRAGADRARAHRGAARARAVALLEAASAPGASAGARAALAAPPHPARPAGGATARRRQPPAPAAQPVAASPALGGTGERAAAPRCPTSDAATARVPHATPPERSTTRTATAGGRDADERRLRVRRAVGVVVHNWPLKLAAIALATLLYAGLVASQDSSTFPGPSPSPP